MRQHRALVLQKQQFVWRKTVQLRQPQSEPSLCQNNRLSTFIINRNQFRLAPLDFERLRSKQFRENSYNFHEPCDVLCHAGSSNFKHEQRFNNITSKIVQVGKSSASIATSYGTSHVRKLAEIRNKQCE